MKNCLDLHGLTVQNAYDKTNNFIYNHHVSGSKKIFVITGRSGIIRKEFDTWMNNNVYVRKFLIDNAGGKFSIWLKKPKTKEKNVN